MLCIMAEEQQRAQPSDSPHTEPTTAHQRALPRAWILPPLLLLAFLLASVPETRSEVWRRLATGRALLAGDYAFGVDPFAYTTADRYWVNHSWLSDLALFVGYQVAGNHLVVLGALGAAAVVGLMSLAADTRRGNATPWLAMAVGAVALAPYFSLSSSMASYALFAFTTWFLLGSRTLPAGNWSLRSNGALLGAFALWANCDEWFLLGPLSVGLYWAASRFPRAGIPLVISSFGVCLLNPHHVFVFRLPAALHATGVEAAPRSGIELLASLGTSPFHLPTAAYGLLLLLMLAILASQRSQVCWRSAAIGIALMGLSLYTSAAIAFFVVFAAPFVVRCWQNAGETTARTGVVPLLSLATLWLLVPLACPGWLQSNSERRGWHLAPDPSLQSMAERLAEWHASGALGNQGRGFNTSVDAAHYLAWFCPQEKVFIDGRPGLFSSETIREFERLRDALAGRRVEASEEADVGRLLERWECTRLYVGDSVDRRLVAMLENLWQSPAPWRLAHLQGKGTIFVDPAAHIALPEYDFHRRAFAPHDADRAPRHGIDHQPIRRPWWDCFALGPEGDPLSRDEAIVLIAHFEAMRHNHLRREVVRDATERLIDAAVMVDPSEAMPRITGEDAALWLAALQSGDATMLDHLAAHRFAAHVQTLDGGPPASLFLAVRAARRAVQADPADGLAHLRLGRAYKDLQQHTVERGSHPAFPLVEQWRKIQAIVALKRAAELRPDSPSPHELLAELYLEAGGFDFALPHVQAQLELNCAMGPRGNELQEDFEQRMSRLIALEEQLGRQIREQQSFVDVTAYQSNVFAKASFAQDNGLPGYALEQLLRSTYAEFGREGGVLQLYLLLHAGRTADFKLMIDPAQEPVMGSFNYRWLETLSASAEGNYDAADDHLRRLLDSLSDAAPPEPPPVERSPTAHLGHAVKEGILALLPLGRHLLDRTHRAAAPAAPGAVLLSDISTIRGMLALESGDMDSARDAFLFALAQPEQAPGSKHIARHYLRLLRER
jgi:tetratricopeptide (TPR) repeat protein